MTRSGGTVLSNEVQATGAYADNSAPVTPNEVDSIALQSAADDFDPFVRVSAIGRHTESGGQTTSGGGNVSRVRVVNRAMRRLEDDARSSRSCRHGEGRHGGMLIYAVSRGFPS
ncbi:hypothetical protein PC111_g23279 [Phytophthora cactorum]|nr:hypothetical protein PC111_g23279 [Phytophthora cactorum]